MTILHFSIPFTLSGRLFEPTMLRRCLLEECHAACCLHGVWVDPLERDDILGHAESILPHMPEGRTNADEWFGTAREEDPSFPSGYVISTAVLPNPAHYGGTECVFLRPDWLCALQVAAVAAGLHHWRWKPFHCILHPLTVEAGGIVTLAPDEELLAEEGSCFRTGTQAGSMLESLAEEIGFILAGGLYESPSG
jgi:hypothetical protein